MKNAPVFPHQRHSHASSVPTSTPDLASTVIIAVGNSDRLIYLTNEVEVAGCIDKVDFLVFHITGAKAA